MASPTLSVILPNYNHAQYVGRALGAILSQSLGPTELIVLDDGSTDDSVSVIEGFAASHLNVRFLRNDRNRGVAYSIVRGQEYATGDYVYYAAADDEVLPGFFEGALGLAGRHPDAGILFGKVQYVDVDGKLIFEAGNKRWASELYAPPEVFRRDFLEARPSEGGSALELLSSATIYRRSHLTESGGFRPELECASDAFAIISVGMKYGACYVPRPCCRFQISDQSYANRMWKSSPTMRAIFAAGARLMREPELRDRFPEDFVVRWEKSCHDELLRRHLYYVCEAARAGRLGQICASLKGLPFGGAAASFLERAWFKVLVEREKWVFPDGLG